MNASFDILRLTPGRTRFDEADGAPRMPIGKSRIGGPIIDWPADWPEPDDDECFAGMLELSWLSQFDIHKVLPKSGFLYFHCRADGTGGARYFNGSKGQLKRFVREHNEWFYKGVTVSRCRNETESIRDWHCGDGGWDYFAGVKKTKLFGIPSDCQKGEKETLKSLKESVLLFQIGRDITGEGCMLYFIAPNALKKRRFDQVTGRWAQS